MRKDNSFKNDHMVNGSLANASLRQGVQIRPYVNGVILHVEKTFDGVDVRLDCEKYPACYPTVVSFQEELNQRLEAGNYLFLWHKNVTTKEASKITSMGAKKALTSNACDKGFVLSPLKKAGLTYDCNDSIELESYSEGTSKKHSLLKWAKIKDSNDFNKKVQAVFNKGFISCVVKVGNKNYRICRVKEESFSIVGFTPSTRWNEVKGILIDVPGLPRPVHVWRGLETYDKRDMYNNPDEFLNTNVVVYHEGFTTTGNLRSAKVRALRVTVNTTMSA
jgi:hypothetical protein